MSALKFLKGRAASALNIEDVFSAYTYTGTGATQTITTGVNLSAKGGLVWCKDRNTIKTHGLFDTARTATIYLGSDTTTANTTQADTLTAFGTTGFTLGADATAGNVNTNTQTYVAWSFAKQAKFFDIQTWTGNGANRTISHSLGAVPGMIMVKRTDTTGGAWMVYHRSLTSNVYYLVLNTTAAEASGATAWNSTTPTASVFSLGTHADVNTNTATYVAYLFAHDTASTGLIQCGSFTGTTPFTITLGWEPQYVLAKRIDVAGNWRLFDVSRQLNSNGTSSLVLLPNASDEESAGSGAEANATGFTYRYLDGTYIYLAIRRGPMAQPTAGTQVYNAIARTGTGAAATVTGVGFPPDLVVVDSKPVGSGWGAVFYDRLRGATIRILSSSTAAEVTNADELTAFGMDGFSLGVSANGLTNNNAEALINWNFRRYPGVFDVVCYTGTGANKTETHNLTVAPELWIVKGRSGATAWTVGCTALANTEYLVTNTTAAKATDATAWNSTFPTTTALSLGTQATVNTSTATYVAYLFATKAGISKVGTYTGNGSTQTIACGFAAGARFVLVKATSTTGNWVVFDSTRGIIAGSDPYLLLNSTAAEDTDEDAVDTDNSGFVVNETTAANVNTNTATYIYLAIA